MNINEVLNADMKVLVPWLKQGLDWWVEELAGMIPEKLRQKNTGKSLAVAFASADGKYRFYKAGEELSPKAVANVPMILVLSRAQVLVRSIDIPQLSPTDTRNLIANELDRWTPLNPVDAAFSHTVCQRDRLTKKNHVRLAVISRTVAAKALEDARHARLKIVRLTYGSGGDNFDAETDFMKTLGHEAPDMAKLDARQFWWCIAVGLLAINVGLALFRDYRDIADLREIMQSQSQTAQLARQIQKRVVSEQLRRENLALLRQRQEPLRVLDILSKSLPDDAAVERFEWDGTSVRLTGYKKGSTDLQSVLGRVPEIASVRSNGSELPPQMELGQPFDLRLTFKNQSQAFAR
jgi:hypothetical protein